jgi:hypothetical protein
VCEDVRDAGERVERENERGHLGCVEGRVEREEEVGVVEDEEGFALSGGCGGGCEGGEGGGDRGAEVCEVERFERVVAWCGLLRARWLCRCWCCRRR